MPLSVYLDSLGIEACDGNAGNFQRCAILSYMGVRGDFYLRTVYRHLVGGGDKYNLDPWNRVFPMFPGSNKLSGFGASGYKMTLYEYEYERFHSSLWGNADDVLNVYVLSTGVCGNRVYCVDVLN